MAGGGGSPHLYQNAYFLNGRFWLCHEKIAPAQNQKVPVSIFVQVLPTLRWSAYYVPPGAMPWPGKMLRPHCNDGPAAAGWQQQPSHHTHKGLAFGKPHPGPAQVLVHDSRRQAGGEAGVFRLALLISDLSPLPSLLGTHGFHIGDKGGHGPRPRATHGRQR